MNRTSLYARELAQRLVTDPEYVASLKARLLDGKLGGDFERVLWAYAFGPPPQHPISVMGDFLEGLLSEEELREIDTTLS